VIFTAPEPVIDGEHKGFLQLYERLTERHVHELAIGDDGNPAIEEWMQHKLAVHVRVAAGSCFSKAHRNKTRLETRTEGRSGAQQRQYRPTWSPD
jgi:hypothetical protein